MTNGWIELDKEPPHRSDEDAEAFAATCGTCPHRLGIVDVESQSGLTFVRCEICKCPLKVVVHRYGNCPAELVPPPSIE